MQQAARRGFEQGGRENIERAERHPQLAQERAHFLGQMFQPGVFAADHPARVDKRDQQRARLRPGYGIARGLGQFAQRGQRFQLLIEPCGQPRLQLRARSLGQQCQIAGQCEAGVAEISRASLAGKGDLRQRAPLPLAPTLAGPADRAARDFQLANAIGQQPFGAAGEQRGQRLFARRQQHPPVIRARRGIDMETESFKPPDGFPLDRQMPIGFQCDRQRACVLPQRLHQKCRPPVDESFGQPRVQRIRKLRLDRARARCHFVACQHPIGPLADVSPAANRRDPPLQRVDVALHPVKFRDARGDEIRANIALVKVLPQPCDKPCVLFHPQVAEIGERARLPEPPDAACPAHRLGDAVFRKPP